MGDQARLGSKRSRSQLSPPLQGELQSNPLPLCEQCRALHLCASDFYLPPTAAAQRTSETEVRDPIALGSRDWLSIKAQTTCPLCCLIAHAVEISTRGWQENDSPQTCKFTLARMNLDDHQDEDINWDLRTLDVSVQYKWSKSDTISLLPAKSALTSEPFVGRRIASDGINAQQILGWLRQCQDGHHDHCESPDKEEFAYWRCNLLVIDVEEDRLTKLPFEGRYVALSYVWGNVDQQQTTLENIQAFSARGGLRQTISNLPKTLADAYSLTKLLNERYLWIDTLCIIQDDETSKQSLIDRMHLIFRFSYLALFAANGVDAHAGLPGVSSPRANAENVATVSEGLDLIYPAPYQRIQSSIWASRGWTYQEYFFSTRRLVFFDQMIVFQCNTLRWREDLGQEQFKAGITYYQTNIGGDRMDWGPSKIARKSNKHNHNRYSEYLTTYLDRNLTDDNDILKAFTGVINHAGSEGLVTHYGLTTLHFALDLLWLPCKWATRRIGFPSWSWAGWKCPIITFHLFPDYGSAGLWTQRMSWIRFYALAEDKEALQLIASGYSPEMEESIQVEERDQAYFRNMRFGIDDVKPIETKITDPWDGKAQNVGQIIAPLLARLALDGAEDQPEEYFSRFAQSCATSLDPKHLLFRTLTASLEISALKPDGHLPQIPRSDEPILPNAPCLYLYTHRGDHIGTAWTHEEAAYNDVLSKCTDDEAFLYVEVAIVAGPVRADLRTRDECPSEHQLMEELVNAGGNARDIVGRHETRANYHGFLGDVLLVTLKEQHPATYEHTPIEELGLDEAFWEDVEDQARMAQHPCHSHEAFEVYKGLILSHNSRQRVGVTTRYFRVLLIGEITGECCKDTSKATQVLGKGEIREDALGLIDGLRFRNIMLE